MGGGYIPSIWANPAGGDLLFTAWQNDQAYREDGTKVYDLDTGGCCDYAAYSLTIDKATGTGFFSSFAQYDLSTGARIAGISLSNGGWVALDGTHLFAFGNGPSVARYNRATAQKEWSVDLTNIVQLSQPAIDTAGAFVSSTGGNKPVGDWQLKETAGGRVVKVDTAGIVKMDVLVNSVTAPVVGRGDVIYVGAQQPPISHTRSDGQLVAVKSDGTVLWKTELGWYPYDLFTGDDGRIYVGTDGGHLFVVSAQSGKIELGFSGLRTSSFMILSDGFIYTSGGQALKLPAGMAFNYDSQAPWPVYRHDNQRTNAR